MARRFLTLLILAATAGCGPSAPPPAPAQRFPIAGQLLGVQLDTGQVVLKHGKVEGYMDAMTMPFSVADRAEVLARRPGDLVTATLVVEPTRVYLEHLTATGTAPLPDGVGARPVAEGVHVRHHVVAEALLVRRHRGEVDVVEVRAHLRDRLVGDRDP